MLLWGPTSRRCPHTPDRHARGSLTSCRVCRCRAAVSTQGAARSSLLGSAGDPARRAAACRCAGSRFAISARPGGRVACGSPRPRASGGWAPRPSASLMRSIDREIGEIGAVAEITDGAGHADQLLPFSRRHDDVGAGQHRADHVGFVNRPPLGECRTDQHVYELGRFEVGLQPIRNRHRGSRFEVSVSPTGRTTFEARRAQLLGCPRFRYRAGGWQSGATGC